MCNSKTKTDIDLKLLLEVNLDHSRNAGEYSASLVAVPFCSAQKSLSWAENHFSALCQFKYQKCVTLKLRQVET